MAAATRTENTSKCNRLLVECVTDNNFLRRQWWTPAFCRRHTDDCEYTKTPAAAIVARPAARRGFGQQPQTPSLLGKLPMAQLHFKQGCGHMPKFQRDQTLAMASPGLGLTSVLAPSTSLQRCCLYTNRLAYEFCKCPCRARTRARNSLNLCV